MFESYYRNVGLDAEVSITLQIVKAGMKVQTDKATINAKNLHDFWPQTNKKGSLYRWHAKFIQILS